VMALPSEASSFSIAPDDAANLINHL